MLKVIEALLDHDRIFDAGDNFRGAAAGTAGLDIDIEYTLEPLCPGHQRSPFDGYWRFIRRPGWVALAPLCQRN